jgi:glycosyltransferase involved in cell wall biosynthesis
MKTIGKKKAALMILSYDDLSATGGSFSLIRDEFDYFEKRMSTIVFSRAPRRNHAGIEGSILFEPIQLPTRFFRLLGSLAMIFFKLSSYSRTLRISVFHAHDVYLASVASIVGRMLRVRSVLTVHGPLAYEFANFYTSHRGQFRFLDLLYLTLLSRIERYAYEHVDAVVPVSEFEKRYVEKVRASNIAVIENGLNLAIFKPFSDGIANNDRISEPVDRRKVVTFVGRLVPKNGILVIAQAIPKVTAIRDDVVFLIVGDGFANEDFNTIIAQAGVSSKVILVGEKKDPVPYFQISDLFVSHVSSLVEGVGLAVLEATACGVPVIVGDDPISRARLNGVAHFVKKDDPSALAHEILSLLDQDLAAEKRNLRCFAELNLNRDVTFRKYWGLFHTGETQ